MRPDTKHSLAESTVSNGGLTWTYHLKPNLRWSDGKPLTAEDVKWTMDFMQRRAPSSAVEAVKRWQVKDRNTVVAHLRHRSVEMKSLWIYILPKHVWKAADNKSWEKFKPPAAAGRLRAVHGHQLESERDDGAREEPLLPARRTPARSGC